MDGLVRYRGAAAPSRLLACLRHALLAALMALAAGCATTPPAPVPPPAGALPLPLQLAGRFSTTYITTLPETRQESASGRFELFKDETRLTVDLISPFGQTIARAEHHAGSPATLQTADNRRFTGATLDEVFERAIGIRVPAEKLPYWLTDRFEQVLERSADGRRIVARDAGWDIDRSDGRWDLVWHEGTQRIEVRLLLDAR
jgi:outer membrane biogenesis lipoprotein LolB